MNPQAEALNEIITGENPAVLDMLSTRGKNIFFPKKGILGQTAEAKGKKFNATIGAAIEDDGSPMRLSSLEKLVNLDPANVFPYAPSPGKPGMRRTWKELIFDKNPSITNKEISMPLVTNALTHALSICGYMFLNGGDELIVSDLYWGNYNLIFANAYNAKIEKFQLFNDKSFHVESFRETMMKSKPTKKVVILNFPNNPTGYTPTVNEVQEIVNILKSSAESGNKIVVIIDDAYFGLVYENDIEKESIFARLANLHDNLLAVKVDGPTKEDYVWGFRTGFLTYAIKGGTRKLYEALEAKTGGAIRGSISNASHLSQSLLFEAYNSPTYKEEKLSKFNTMISRYKAVKESLKNEEYNEYFTPYPFNSGYFMCLKLAGGIDGEKLRKHLLDKYSTGIINMNNVIRLAFSAVAAKDIPLVFENIYNACKEVK